MSDSLGARAIEAGRWRLAGQTFGAVLQFGTGVVLARLLAPRDFGLMAFAWILVGLVSMSELGLAAALVQRRELTERHVRAAFTATVLIGAGLAATTAALAPLMAWLVRDPAAGPVLASAGVVFLIAAFAHTPTALLRRSLSFRTLFWIDAGTHLAGYGIVAPVLALRGWGVWSLVVAVILQNTLAAAWSIHAARPPLRPLLARAELRELWGFGAGASLSGFVGYLARNADNLVVGARLGAAPLGLYSRAYNLMLLPQNHIGRVMSGVLFPALSRLQGDAPRLSRAYLLSVQLAALVAGPLMAGMLVAGPHLVAAVYGPGWEGAVLPLQILCGAGLLRVVTSLAEVVAHSTGHVAAQLRLQLGYAVLVIAGSSIGSLWGIAGTALAVALAIAAMYVATARLALRITGAGWRPFARAHVPGLLVSFIVGGTALVARLALEQRGLGSGAVLPGIVAACALALPIAVYLLPDAIRPTDLFTRLATIFERLPRPVRLAVGQVLRPGV